MIMNVAKQRPLEDNSCCPSKAKKSTLIMYVSFNIVAPIEGHFAETDVAKNRVPGFPKFQIAGQYNNISALILKTSAMYR